MAELELPTHVVSQRRDGRREVLLHRAMAVISDDKVEIKAARSTFLLPIIGLALVTGAGLLMIETAGSLPFWLMVVMLLASLFIAPASVMGLVSSIAGANVVVDRRKGSLTMQQGYLGMGIGTKELVPFGKIDHLEVTLEGDQPDRWKGNTDSIRQFAIVLVKQSGKRLRLSNVPVSEGNQADGIDRTLAVANAIAAIAETTVTIPEGWELVEIEVDTGNVIENVIEKREPAETGARRKGGKRGRRH